MLLNWLFQISVEPEILRHLLRGVTNKELCHEPSPRRMKLEALPKRCNTG